MQKITWQWCDAQVDVHEVRENGGGTTGSRVCKNAIHPKISHLLSLMNHKDS